MQQFTVPQFIDVEAKILGPITVRQFIIILAGAIIGGISYRFFDFSLFLTITIFSLVFIGLFGFAKINSRPFHIFIVNFMQTMVRKKVRVWNNGINKSAAINKNEEINIKAEVSVEPVKRYTTSRLAELSLIVDTGGAFRGEDDDQVNIGNLNKEKDLNNINKIKQL